MPGLADAVALILDAVADAIEAEAVDGGDLEGATVIRGDRARPLPRMPALWVIAEPATATQEVYGGEEGWTMPIRLVAMEKDDAAGTGGDTARTLAATARKVAMRDRRLGFDWVIDTRSLTFDPWAPPPDGNRTLYRADARLNVLFSVEEDES